MTEFAATGRYYATFTPDAEGEWLVVMRNTTDSNGDAIKAFAVAGHNVDSIGDLATAIDTLTKASGPGDLAAMKGVLDTESGVKAAVEGLNDFDPANDPVAVVTELTGHTPQTGDSYALANGDHGFVAIKDAVDTIASPAMVG
jgi:hypothetical protein